MPQAVNLSGYIGRMVEKMKMSRGVGTCAGVVRVVDPRSGNGDSANLDRFTLTFPYGGLYLRWEVIFNVNYPEQPPDFIFITDGQSFNPDIQKLKTLSTWDWKDEESLLKLMRELIVQYKQHQLEILAGSKVFEEVQGLLQFKVSHNEAALSDCPAEVEKADHQDSIEVEVFSSCNESTAEQVHVMIRIPVLLPNLTHPPHHVGTREKMLVLMTYEGFDGQLPACQVFPSPKLEKALAGLGGMACSACPRDRGMLDHVTNVTNKLNSMIDLLKVSADRRKAYVESLSCNFVSHVVEYDSTNFHNVNLLFSVHHSSILLTIDLSSSFPSTQPHLTFTSMNGLRQDRGLMVKRVRDYPYSPRWSAEEMAARMRKFIEGNLARIEQEMHIA